MPEHQVYLSIGSNLGDCRNNCEKSLEELQSRNHKIVKQSSWYKTKPIGFADQPDFLNIAVELLTDATPWELLADLKQIEREMGRKTLFRWGPRVIDLDILLYNKLEVAEAELIIPHPRMHKRAFVLVPLLEISPDLIHPVWGNPFSEFLNNLKDHTDYIEKLN